MHVKRHMVVTSQALKGIRITIRISDYLFVIKNCTF